MGILKTILLEVETVLAAVDEKQIATFTDQLLAASRIFVTGEGRSGFMAKAFAMRLMHLGLPVYVVGETTTPSIQGSDTLVAVSGSGTTGGTVCVAQQATGLGSTLLAVTTNPEAQLGKLATHTLVIPAATKWRREGEMQSSQPLGSLFDQCCHIALDAVCLRVAELQEITNETARQRHTNVE